MHQGAWKQSHKKQVDGGSSDSDKAPIQPSEPTLSPKSLRPARRMRKPLKIDNPYNDSPMPPPQTTAAPQEAPPSPSAANSPADSEDDKEPEMRAPSANARRGGRGRGLHLSSSRSPSLLALSQAASACCQPPMLFVFDSVTAPRLWLVCTC